MTKSNIPLNENQQIDFKESWRDEFLKHICAFANSHGGKLIIGIKDNGTIIGIKDSKKLLEDIPNKIVQQLGIVIDIEEKIQNGRDLLEIIVLPSSVPISYHSKYYTRSGSTVQELHGQQLREFILKKDNITWDEIEMPLARIDELDENIVRRFVSKAVNANRLSAEAINEKIALTLQKLDLVKENGRLTRAAILLFGNRPYKYVRTATVKIGRFGKSDADLISHDIIEGNILDMPERIIDLLRTKYLHSPITYEGIERKERLEYPEKAIREAVLNAIVHRDYGEHTDITIKVFEDRIIIWNSGTLIAPLNIDMLKQEHPSKRRNALIANIFFRIGYIEAWGRGILLMEEEMAKTGLPEPIIEEYAGGFQITFEGKAKTTNKTTNKTTSKTTSKTANRIIEIIISNPTITAKGIADVLNLSEEGVRYHIKRLKKQMLIKHTGSAKEGYWEIIE